MTSEYRYDLYTRAFHLQKFGGVYNEIYYEGCHYKIV